MTLQPAEAPEGRPEDSPEYQLRARWRRGTLRGFGVRFASAILGTAVLIAGVLIALYDSALEAGHWAAVAVAALLWAGAIGAIKRVNTLVVRWYCPACGKRLGSDEPWMCGFCDYENRRRSFSFLHECERCEAQPPGYVCHHCGVATAFVRGADNRHPAQQIPQPRPGETEEQARTRRGQELAEKRYEIESLKHDAEIQQLKNQAERLRSPPRLDPDQAMEEQLEKALHRLKVGMQAVARSKKLQTEVDHEISTNSAGLPAQEVERLREYAKRQFDGYREDITLGRYDG